MPSIRIHMDDHRGRPGGPATSDREAATGPRRLTAMALAVCAMLCFSGCSARTPFPEGDVVVENPHDLFKSDAPVMARLLKAGINQRLRWRHHEQVHFSAGGPVIRVTLLQDQLRTDEGGFWAGASFARTLTATVVIGEQQIPLAVTSTTHREDGAQDRFAGSATGLGSHPGRLVLPPEHEVLLELLAEQIADRIAGTRLEPDWRD
ncbi:MAG: hypothetical protein H0X38_10620 [Planctomycetes bacterium]|nr:hypothetical protein [Planctomycetota bacterium]